MSADDCIILTTCQIHDSRGFCNLRVSKVDDSCVLSLDEAAATQLFDILGEWLG